MRMCNITEEVAGAQRTVGGVEAELKTSHWIEPLRDGVNKNGFHGVVETKDRLIKDRDTGGS